MDEEVKTVITLTLSTRGGGLDSNTPLRKTPKGLFFTNLKKNPAKDIFNKKGQRQCAKLQDLDGGDCD